MGLFTAVWRRLHRDWSGRRTGPNDRRHRDDELTTAVERRRGPSDRRNEDRRRRPAVMTEELA